MTEFKQIESFQYEINSDGVVRRVHKKGTYKIMKPSVNKQTGYLMVSLCKEQKHYWFSLHRLVATHFIPNPENKPCVDHINRDRQDNTLSNLRWVTYSENNANIYHERKPKVYKFTEHVDIYTYVGGTFMYNVVLGVLMISPQFS
jgi:hypothetical protein